MAAFQGGNRMADSIVNTFLELAPWFLVGMLISGALHVLLPRDFIKRQLRGRFGVAKAVALGVPLPLCSCGVIPAGIGLKREGAGNGPSLGFLISTPQTGVDSILVSASFLGWPFALFKVVAAVATGLIGGWISDRVPDTDAQERDLGTAIAEDEKRGFKAFVTHSYDLLASIWRWLVFGVLVSAAINAFLPDGTLSVFAELGPFAAGLAVLVVSLPLYVCATASVPIAAAMVANGMPVGAALVFLMAGPATNVATIGAIYRGFGARQLAVYLGVLIVGSIGFGVLFDLGINPIGESSHVHGEPHRGWWEIGSAILLAGLILRLALADASRFFRARNLSHSAADALEIPIVDMSCDGCIGKIEKALLAVEGVVTAVVTRNPDRAVVKGDAPMDQLDQAIFDAGYHTKLPT
jgi:uncharacterized membrane protein YraQ (UPF0718 family)/copper chaperone CopZ